MRKALLSVASTWLVPGPNTPSYVHGLARGRLDGVAASKTGSVGNSKALNFDVSNHAPFGPSVRLSSFGLPLTFRFCEKVNWRPEYQRLVVVNCQPPKASSTGSGAFLSNQRPLPTGISQVTT